MVNNINTLAYQITAKLKFLCAFIYLALIPIVVNAQSLSNADQSMICTLSNGITCNPGDPNCLCQSYDECAPLYGMSGIYVRPISQACADTCSSECSKFSTLNNNVELNSDLISMCNYMCKNGLYFSANKRTANLQTFTDRTQFIAQAKCTPTDTINVAGFSFPRCNIYPDASNYPAFYYNSLFYTLNSSPTATSNTCNMSTATAPYNSLLTVRSGGQITVTVSQVDPTVSNEIILCGHDIRQRDPDTFPMSNGNIDSDWSGMSWARNRFAFHAKNYNPYNPRLIIRDGDYFNLTYYGYDDCGSGCGATTMIIRKPDGATSSNPSGVYNGDWFSGNSSQYQYLGGNTWSGLTLNSSNNITLPGQTQSFTKNVYSGILTGFSPRYSLFGFQHGEGIDVGEWLDDWYDDNWGGYFVNLERKGCVFTNGQQLQLAIGRLNSDGVTYATPDPNNSSLWTNLTFTQQGNQYITQPLTANISGQVFFKIQRLAPPSASTSWDCSTADSVCKAMDAQTELNRMYNNVEGQYYVTTSVDNSNASGQ